MKVYLSYKGNYKPNITIGTKVGTNADSPTLLIKKNINHNLVGDGTTNLFVVKYRRVRDPDGKKVKN